MPQPGSPLGGLHVTWSSHLYGHWLSCSGTHLLKLPSAPRGSSPLSNPITPPKKNVSRTGGGRAVCLGGALRTAGPVPTRGGTGSCAWCGPECARTLIRIAPTSERKARQVSLFSWLRLAAREAESSPKVSGKSKDCSLKETTLCLQTRTSPGPRKAQGERERARQPASQLGPYGPAWVLRLEAPVDSAGTAVHVKRLQGTLGERTVSSPPPGTLRGPTSRLFLLEHVAKMAGSDGHREAAAALSGKSERPPGLGRAVGSVPEVIRARS